MRASVIYQKIIGEGVQIGKQEGRQPGRQEEASRLILPLLTRRFGVVDTTLAERINQLSIMRLEDWGDALFDFANISDLTSWLTQYILKSNLLSTGFSPVRSLYFSQDTWFNLDKDDLL